VRERIFYGWWIVVICLMALAVSFGIGFYSIGIFFNPLMEEFGWNRTQVSAVVTVYWGIIALTSPGVGRFLDLYGPTRTMFMGLMGSTLFLSLLSLTRSLVYFYFMYALLAISHISLSSIPYGYLISRWFQRKRGTAMGITTAGISLGGVIITPIANALITTLGWRMAYLLLGVCTLGVMLPLLLFIKEGPEQMGLAPDGQRGEISSHTPPPPEPVWRTGEALRTPVFWMASLGLFLVYGTVFGTLSHQVPFFRDMGMAPARAATLFSFTAAMGVVGKLIFGYLMDKLPPRAVVSSCFLLQALGLFILLFTRDPFFLWAFVLIFGFSMGGTATLRPLIVTWLFGLGSYGTIFGAIQVFQSLGSSLFPLLGGIIFDATGTYQWAFLLFAAMAVVSGMLYIFLPSPSHPSHIGNPGSDRA
jgi:sugar phosphate permease